MNILGSLPLQIVTTNRSLADKNQQPVDSGGGEEQRSFQHTNSIEIKTCLVYVQTLPQLATTQISLCLFFVREPVAILYVACRNHPGSSAVFFLSSRQKFSAAFARRTCVVWLTGRACRWAMAMAMRPDPRKVLCTNFPSTSIRTPASIQRTCSSTFSHTQLLVIKYVYYVVSSLNCSSD